MTGALLPPKPRLSLALLLAACAVLGGTGCATTTRAALTAPSEASESTVEAAPAPEPEKPRAQRARAKVKPAAPRPAPEKKTPVAGRPAPERKRPQGETSLSASAGPVPFEPSRMTRPEKLSGREPELTPQARSARVRGSALLRCIITRQGEVTGCRTLKPLPHMEKELHQALSTWRVTPVTLEGRPVEVDYTFVIRLPAG